MAEKKTVSASESSRKKRTTESGQTVVSAKSQGSATGKRVGAVVLWVVAIALEVLAILLLFGKIEIGFMNTLTAVIILLVLDLIAVICGSLLWKKANHIDPASEKNKVKFFLWNNMGVIACIIAFLPFIIMILTDKENKDPKMKKIAGIAAAIAIVIGVLFSIDWHPISEEAKTEQVKYQNSVYYTQFGKKYHLYDNCQHINTSDTKTEGTVEEAINHGCNDVCKTCADNYEKENGKSYLDIKDAVEEGAK